LAPLNQAQDWAGLDALLLPMDYALAGLPRLTLEAAAVKRLRHGQTVLLTPDLLGLLPAGSHDAIALYDIEQSFIGVGMQDGTELKVRRLLNTANS
jgi:tRNA pseudouridine55 synthase